MTNTPIAAVEPVVTQAPKMLRLLRDGLVWQYNAPWPSPGNLPPLPFKTSDIFYDEEEEIFIVFGMPTKPKKGEEPSEFYAKGLCIFARVPLDLGSAIVESVLPIQEAIAEVKNYLAESEDAWAERWSEDEEDEEPELPETKPEEGEAT
jgi:hypothetical protein